MAVRRLGAVQQAIASQAATYRPPYNFRAAAASHRYLMVPSDRLPGYPGEPWDMPAALRYLAVLHGAPEQQPGGMTLRLHTGSAGSHMASSGQHVHSSGTGYTRGGGGGGSYHVHFASGGAVAGGGGGGGGSAGGGSAGGGGAGGSVFVIGTGQIYGGGGSSHGLPQHIRSHVPVVSAAMPGVPAIPSGLTPGIPGFSGSGQLAPAAAEEIPDSFEPVRGYRWWSLEPAPTDRTPDGRLWEPGPLTGMRDTWRAGENIARCKAAAVPDSVHPASQIPLEPCGCGFWAYWQLQHYDVNSTAYPVCGVVEGYGAVILGELGFRAAKARIIALAVPFTLMPVSAARRVRGSPWERAGFTGKVHFHGMDPYPDGSIGREEAEAAERRDQADADAWMGIIHDRLAVMHPAAEVFGTVAAMMAKYPPDKGHGPDTQPCPHCGTPSADLYSHLSSDCQVTRPAG